LPNRLPIAFLLAATPFAVLSPATHAAETSPAEVIAECASPAGLGRYFRGDIVSSEAVRPVSAAVEQHLSLVHREDGYDLLLRADGVVRSVRATGASIKAVVAEGGAIHHLMVEQDGYLDHFVFQAAAGGAARGKVIWVTQRITRDESGTMASAPCGGS
jgi:hypothetical protein